MARRTIQECDRCHREIAGAIKLGKSTKWEMTGRKGHIGHDVELCTSCSSKLDKFMAGEELEVPP